MPTPLPTLAMLALAIFLGGCASRGVGEDGTAPVRAVDDRPLEFRQPALVIAVSVDAGALGERERLAADYEGALLEALNAKAIAVRDVGRADPGRRPDVGAALARAREIGADSTIIVRARVALETVTVCRETRRPLRGQALVVHQDVEVVRASDGATRLRIVASPSLDASEVEIDCEQPRAARRAGVRAAMEAAVAKLARRLFGA